MKTTTKPAMTRRKEVRVVLTEYTTCKTWAFKVFWWPAARGYRVVGIDNSAGGIVYPSDVPGVLTANNIAVAALESFQARKAVQV